MKLWVITLPLFVMPCAYCQVSAASIRENPPFQSLASPNQWHKVVQNQESSSLDALYALYKCPRGDATPIYATTIFDALVNYSAHQRSIPPSGSIEIESGDSSECSGGIKAAIFADGHAEGNAEEIKFLYDQRQGAYNALEELLLLFRAVSADKDSIENVFSTIISRLAEARKLHTAQSVGYCLAYVLTEHALETGHVFHVPSDSTPQRVPSVTSLISKKGLSRDQAQGTVLEQKLEEWHSALEGHLHPSSDTR